MAGGVCSVAGLVTERFGGAKTSMPGGFTPPEQMKSTGSPWGMARHGKAFEGLLKRCFGQEKVHKSERFEREWGDPFPLFFLSSKGRRYRGPLNVSACGRNHAEQGLLASCAAGWSADRRERGAGAPRLWAR